MNSKTEEQMKRKKISGAVRYLGYENDLNGLVELRKAKEKIALFLTTTPLSENKERMSYYDMIKGTAISFDKDVYINQFVIFMTKKELLELKEMIDKKIKQ